MSDKNINLQNKTNRLTQILLKMKVIFLIIVKQSSFKH